MARRVRDANLETRNARRALKVHAKPYWRSLDKGLHLGYRKRASGGSWIVRRFTEAGKYSESRLGLADDFQDADGVKTFDYSRAQKEARKWYEAEIRQEAGLEEAHDGPYNVDDAMRDYMKHYSIEGKAVVAVQSSINTRIKPVLGKLDAARITTKQIADWHHNIAASSAMLRTGRSAQKPNVRLHAADDHDAIRRRRATANRVLTTLKAALNYAWKEGRVASDNAWRKVKPFRNVDAPVMRYLTEEQCTRLVNACYADFRLLVQGALLTGCRYGELAALKANDFNPDSGTVAIRVSKSGKVRHVVLTDEGKKFFRTVTLNKQGTDFIFTRGKNGIWGASHQTRMLAESCKHAKIKPAISFHILRHTHGSMLAMKGVPMPVIAKQLGHADTRMTEKHYAHISPNYIAETIRQNFPTLGIVAESNVTILTDKK
jgi:integrase